VAEHAPAKCQLRAATRVVLHLRKRSLRRHFGSRIRCEHIMNVSILKAGPYMDTCMTNIGHTRQKVYIQAHIHTSRTSESRTEHTSLPFPQLQLKPESCICALYRKMNLKCFQRIVPAALGLHAFLRIWALTKHTRDDTLFRQKKNSVFKKE